MNITDYRPFGRTGVKVSPLALGCMMFGGRTDLAESCRIIDHALDLGINILDTANVYNEGRSEEVTGEALKRNGKRDRVFLCTKVHGVMDKTDPNGMGNSRRHIIAQCEASLRRLQTDHIDLYQMHRPEPAVPIDETLRALDDLIRAGKVRYAGTSTFAAWQVVESLWCARELGLNRFVCEQPPYNLIDRRIERELLPVAQTFGIAVIPWSPIAGGLLTGKYDPNRPPPEGTRFFDYQKNPYLARRWTAAALQKVEAFKPLARAKGCTLSQFALAWVLQRPGVTAPIIGPRTYEQFEDNLRALAVSFTPEELAKIDELAPPGTNVAPYYEADFGPHPHRW